MSPSPPTVHATALVLGTSGVLLRGPSGAGKSTLALALLRRWTAEGRFAALVSDDRVVLEAVHGRLLARAVAPIAGKVELAGRGILPVDHVPAAVVRLVVDLVPAADLARMPEAEAMTAVLHGVELDRQPVPARAVEPASLLVDAALAALGRGNRAAPVP